jgi:hypothetical protein
MRITRETLLKIADDAVARQARTNSGLLAAYLCGSLLGDDFLLGGATDIDLVFIYTIPVPQAREVVRLTDEIHLDVAHQDQKEYREPRRLREQAWMGATLNTCKVLYDPQHFMDFTQASVRGQFDRSDHVFARARSQAEEARRLWMSFPMHEIDGGPQEVETYLKALEHAANAVASLTGAPLTERRFLLHYGKRAEAVGKPGLLPGLLGLLGAPALGNELASRIEDWMGDWQAAYQAACAAGGMVEAEATRLHPDRLVYYSAAFQSLLVNGQAEAVLWPLLRSWTWAARRLRPESAEVQAWRQAFARLGLSGLPFTGRVEALDAYLDVIDETLETWARLAGAWQD